MNQLRSDLYFLLLAPARQRLVVLTIQTMFLRCPKKVQGGRVPNTIEFVQAELPETLAARLLTAQRVASQEVTPGTTLTEDRE